MWFFKKEKDKNKKFKKIIEKLKIKMDSLNRPNLGVPLLSINEVINIKNNKMKYIILDTDFFMAIMVAIGVNAILGFNFIMAFIISFLTVFLFCLVSILNSFLKDIGIFSKIGGKNEIGFYKSILDLVDNDILRENLNDVVKIAFLNKIGFELEEYVNKRLGDESYINTFYSSMDILKTYLIRLRNKEVIDFFNNNNTQQKLSENLSDVELLDIKREYVLVAAEEYIRVDKNRDKDKEIYEILSEFGGDSAYIKMLEKRLGIEKVETDLLNQLNRNVKNVVF